MATSYPGGLDSFTNPTASDPLNSATVPHATQHANANDAIEAIQAELGTDPAGAAATVAARLTTIEGDITTIEGDARWTDARTPTAHAASHASAGSDPITIAQSQVTDLGVALAGKVAYVDLPYHVSIPGLVIPSAATGGYSQNYGNAMIYNAAVVTPGGINNYLEWTFTVAAGTYTLRTMFRKSTNYGIAHVSIDGGAALGTTIDHYAAAAANNFITDITGIALTAGRHTVRYTAASKNASSTGYFLYLHGLAWTRTGD